MSEANREEQTLAMPPGAGTQPAAAFDGASALLVAGAHLTLDLYPAFLGPLLPVLIEKHGLNLVLAGTLVTIPSWLAVLMPFFGHLADRTDARRLVIWAPAFCALTFSALGLAPTTLALVLLITAGSLAGAAFHPAAGALATRVGGREWGRAISYYMTGGQIGRAVGPAFIVAVIAAFSFEAMWVAALPALLVSGLAYVRLGTSRRYATHQAGEKPADLRPALGTARGGLTLLCTVVALRSLGVAAFEVYYATYLTGVQATLVYAGFALALFEGGGIVGMLIGGSLSDRYGRRRVMAISQAASVPLLLATLAGGSDTVALLPLGLGGLLVLSTAPVQLALAQELMPLNRSAANGIILFVTFFGTVLASVAVGLTAGLIGLGPALAGSTLLSALAVPLAMLLPSPAPEPPLTPA